MTIGIGLIGASRIARDSMIPVFAAHPDCELVSVYSSNFERGKEYAAANGIKRAAASVDELVNDPEVHAVYVSTTNELHHAQVLAAAKAGKHVLCEKPIAMSVQEGREMVAACHEAGVVMATNHHLRNAAPIRKLKGLVTSGAIGKPIAARVFHAVYLPENLQGWRINDASAGGGVVMDIVVHDIDTLRFILGTEPLEVVSMSQSAGMAESVEDGNMAVFRFDDGLLAQVHTAFTVKYGGDGIELHGTEGSLRVTGVLGRRPGSAITLTNAQGEQQITVAHHSLDAETVRQFIDAVQGKGQAAASGEDGLKSMAAALACLEAGKLGTRINIG
ncbi:MAG: Gfo/Idh/MocA family oxidoreductase [Thiolinea sp.]